MSEKHKRFFKVQLVLAVLMLGGLGYFALVGNLFQQDKVIMEEALTPAALPEPIQSPLTYSPNAEPGEVKQRLRDKPLHLDPLSSKQIQTVLFQMAEGKSPTGWQMPDIDWVASLERDDQFALFDYLKTLPVTMWKEKLAELEKQGPQKLRASLPARDTTVEETPKKRNRG